MVFPHVLQAVIENAENIVLVVSCKRCNLFFPGIVVIDVYLYLSSEKVEQLVITGSVTRYSAYQFPCVLLYLTYSLAYTMALHQLFFVAPRFLLKVFNDHSL
jgi:hypothetical protein